MPRRADPDLAIECDDLSIARGGVRVAEGITLRLAPGDSFALMGATGAGKSSIVSVLAGVEDASLSVDGGSASVAGISVRKRGRARRLRTYATGYLAQGAGAGLPARLTVAEVIGEPVTSRDRRINRRALSLRIAALLDELQLPLGAVSKYPYELSSGMRQRVALARALVLQPKVFVGDEPYANLDLDVRRAARDALLRRRDDGMAVLVVTNDAESVRELDATCSCCGRGNRSGSGTASRTSCGLPAEAIAWHPEPRLGS